MFALGTTAGAVVALLTAPGSGKETRRRLANSLQQARKKASHVSGSLADSFGRGTEARREGGILSFDKDPAHVTGSLK
jgi:gas vesicle protein